MIRSFAFRASGPLMYRGHGYVAGFAPASGDPDAPDGRFKRVNVPSRGRVCVYERLSMLCVGQTLSATDGTWLVGGLSLDHRYVVVGFDDKGIQNAAIQDWIAPADPAAP